MHSTQPVWFSPKATGTAVCQYLYSHISVTVALSFSVPWIRDRDKNTYNRKVTYTKKPLDMQPWVVAPALPTDSPSLGFGLGSFLVLLSVNEGVTDATETRLLRISSSSGRKDSRFTTVPMLDFCVSQGWDHCSLECVLVHVCVHVCVLVHVCAHTHIYHLSNAHSCCTQKRERTHIRRTDSVLTVTLETLISHAKDWFLKHKAIRRS